MTHDLDELYQELILEHNKSPRNFRIIENADRLTEGFNPLCGDRYKLYLKLKNGMIEDIGFQGSGCAISKASASMMTASVKGKKVEEAETLFENFHSMLSGKARDEEKLGKLTAFAGVSEFPIRVKCANLAWHALRAGLKGNQKSVSTE